MLDYDGTLAPFVKVRMQAFPYPGVNERLNLLESLKNTRLVIVSGRCLSDLEILLGDQHQIELWGSHGFERKLPNGEKSYGKIDEETQVGLKKGTEACIENIYPEQCEIKPFSIALHWRGVDVSKEADKIAIIRNIWEDLTTRFDLEIFPFAGGIELRPTTRNKGDVVNELLNEMPKNTPAAYLGDDHTDEDAFTALGTRGLKVLVNDNYQKTLADMLLIPPKELLEFLDQWILNNKEIVNVSGKNS